MLVSIILEYNIIYNTSISEYMNCSQKHNNVKEQSC